MSLQSLKTLIGAFFEQGEGASKQAPSPNIVEIRAKLIYHCVSRIVLYVVMESGDRDRESIFWFL